MNDFFDDDNEVDIDFVGLFVRVSRDDYYYYTSYYSSDSSSLLSLKNHETPHDCSEVLSPVVRDQQQLP